MTDYMGEYIYRNNVLSRIINTEGACVRQSNGSFVYEYDMKDHLGNTRVTFSDVNNDWTIDPNTEVSQINHYYPYGLNMVGNWNGQVGANKYQYNGKEWNGDYGLDWNDYGARFYDPAIGRWVTVDPESESGVQRSVNPYHYVYDNPIKNTDPDGREPEEGCCGGIGTRISGALQALGGASEMAAGAALILTPEPTFLTKVGGVAAAVHGADNVSAGFTKLVTGKDQETLTSQGLQAAGMSKSNAETANAVIGIVATGGASIAANTTKQVAKETVKTGIQANKAAGDAFRDKIADILVQNGKTVTKEVGKKTPFGWRYIDIEVSQGGKVLGGIETKLGGSRYTTEQAAKDWYLKIVHNYTVDVVRKK